MAEYTHVGPGLPPLHGARANALILGSFPSPKSREQGFFYGHKQNRFWPMIAAVTGEPVPDWADIEAKKAIILKHGLAVWDTIGACDIKGASDASIRNAVPNDVAALIQKLGVRAVFCNGAASGRIYAKYAEPLTHLPAAVLPAPTPPTPPGPRAAAGGMGRCFSTVFARGWLQVNGFCSIMNLCQTPVGADSISARRQPGTERADMESAPTE